MCVCVCVCGELYVEEARYARVFPVVFSAVFPEVFPEVFSAVFSVVFTSSLYVDTHGYIFTK